VKIFWIMALNKTAFASTDWKKVGLILKALARVLQSSVESDWLSTTRRYANIGAGN
jgi:hypothetical protein